MKTRNLGKEIFNKANQNLNRDDMRNWLAFCYGVFERRITESDIMLFEHRLKQKTK